MEEPKNIVVVDDYALANPAQRIAAFLVDYIISAALFFVPYIGPFLSVIYILTRDGWAFLKNKSIGKTIFHIRVIKGNNYRISLGTSIKRNIIFLPNILLIIPHTHLYYAVFIIDLILLLLETYLIYTSDDSQRLGDSFADTLVIRFS